MSADREPSSPRLGNNEFVLTPQHLNRHDLQQMRTQHDVLASTALPILHSLRSQRDSLHNDLYTLLQGHHHTHPVLDELWESVTTVPDWVNWNQIQRGQKMFWRYGFPNLIGFAMQGFMGGNAATPSIAEVLIRTGGFSTHVVLRRALETFQGLLETTHSLERLQPGGKGHVSLIRVRLLHASVRLRMLKLCELDSGYFDVKTHGIPINTCDDVHTIVLFACNPVWLGLPAMGLQPRGGEIEDYIALFRYVAYVLGVPDRFFAHTTIAKRTMEAFCVLECEPNETSVVLCHNFVAALEDVGPINLSAGFIYAASSAINGQEVSDALGLGRPHVLHVATFWGFCWLAKALIWLQRLVPSFDEYMIASQRELLYAYIVEGNASAFGLGGPSRFEIKHIPRLNKRTPSQASRPKPGVLIRLEWAFLVVLLTGCSLGLALCAGLWRAVLATPAPTGKA